MVRVLIIDDSEVVRDRVSSALRNAGVCDDFIFADDGVNGVKALLENQVDLVLCDLVMPGIDGYKFLMVKNSKKGYEDVPVIMLTGQEHVNEKVRALRAGASDYITKPFHDEELVARFNVHLRIKELQDELRTKNEQLKLLTRTDPLTGIANRRHFMESLQSEFRRAQRYRSALAFMMADLDRFKSINDTYGHLFGDQALIAVSCAFTEALREHDLVGRYGGEEFGMLLPETDLAGAAVVAERCRSMIESCKLSTNNGDSTISITVSLGVAAIPAAKIEAPDDLIRVADEALFAAKQGGRNQVRLANG